MLTDPWSFLRTWMLVGGIALIAVVVVLVAIWGKEDSL